MMNAYYECPPYMSDECIALLNALMQKNPLKRLSLRKAQEV